MWVSQVDKSSSSNYYGAKHTKHPPIGGGDLDDAAGNEGTLISPSLATDPEPNPRFSPSLVSFTLGLLVSEAPAVAHHSPAFFWVFFFFFGRFAPVPRQNSG